MSSWNDPTRWRGLVDGTACPICQRGRALHVVAELESGWLTMPEDGAMPGYACLVARTHAVELHDLPDEEATQFMRDVRRVGRAVLAATGAVKLNYEIHGNTLPHLHMHFFPRYRGDAFEGRAIEPGRARQPVYAGGEYEATRDRVLAALGEG
jgi:diadenosine tetraphosphate (Ap4A) HIT family hydrolase